MNVLLKRFFALGLIFCTSVAYSQEAEIKEVLYSQLPGGKAQVNLITSDGVALPESFYTSNPSRISFDFFNVKKRLPKNVYKVGIGKLDSIVAVETETRTRIIFNLNGVAKYEVNKTNNGYAILIDNTQVADAEQNAPKPFAAKSDLANSSNTVVDKIDFRRTPEGGGNLIINLSDDKAVIDTRDKDGEVVVDILDANLPKELERRLDVVDFATPVQSIDAFQSGEDVRIVLTPKGRFQHISLQTGKEFNLSVNPIIETAADKKRREDEALGFKGDRLSLNFQKIEVRSALAVIADFTGINFVTSDSVEGEITLNLKDVPWDQALEVIMRAKNLAKRENGNVIWIAPVDEIAEAEEKELKANAAAAELRPLISEIIQVNYAKATDIVEVIRSTSSTNTGSSVALPGAPAAAATPSAGNSGQGSLLSSRGTITVDPRTNTLLVKDVASQIKTLRKLIAKLDKPVRQVMIETRIVEASDTFSRELGSRLGFQRITNNAKLFGSGSNLGEIVSSGTTEGLTTIQNSQIDDEPGLIFDTSRGTPGGLAVDLGANGLNGNVPASYAFDIFRTGTGFSHLITLELSALEADGRGKVIASPRLVTASQQEASIRQGEERVFTVRGDEDVEVETKEAVLSLTVTPQITPDDRVILDVNITQDSFIPNANPQVAAALSTKEIVTQVLTDNGETIVIGGIYQEENTFGVTKVPFLGDIPYLGKLFKRVSKREGRTELLIFLTPKIISPKLDLD